MAKARENFYIYLLIHLIKHYSGVGLRAFMDIWVYRRRYKNEMDWAYIEAELDKVGPREFTENVCGLGEAWFGGGQSNELHREMAAYVFSSGAYGTWKHFVISSLGIREGKAKLPPKYAYRMKLFFHPAESLKASYPFLGRLLQLQPVCWILRGIKCLLFKRRPVLRMIG